jgi:hypothetical protein
MKATSVFVKFTVLAILMALVLSSFPSATALAAGNNNKLEDKWDQLITNFDRQSATHNSAHNWVENWLKSKHSASDKQEVQKHLDICNSALASAGSIVSIHAGFDAKGKVVDRALAIKSIKDLSYYLQQHAGSIRNLRGHIQG